jgi:hypothetical protein
MDGLGLVLDSTLLAAHALKTGKLVMPFGPLGVKVISHRLIYRRADRHDPFMMSFIEWITKKIATDSDPLRAAKNPKTALKLQK